jgi:magnesium transporter
VPASVTRLPTDPAPSTTGDRVPLVEPVLGQVSNLLTGNVPITAPDDDVREVLIGLVGHTYDEVDDIAVCDHGRLVGLATIEALTAAPPGSRVQNVMDADPPVIAPGVDQEEAAWRMVHHHESSLAVVDDQGRFLGVIPPYRVLATLLREHDQAMARLGGYLHDTDAARRASDEPLRRRLWHRLPWLAVGLAGAMAAALLVGGFEAELAERVLVAFFIPGIVYMADAVGTQTETLIIRGLSVGVHVRRVVRLEVLTGLVIGCILGLVFFPLGLLIWGEADVALTVSIALFAACGTSSVIALALPWLLHHLGVDPAFGSGPLATVVQDLLSILIYLNCVRILL